MSEETTVQQNGFFLVFNKVLPFANWAITLAVTIGVAFLAFHDSAKDQTAQISEIRQAQVVLKETIDLRKTERDKQFDEIKKGMLPRDVFEAYHQNDVSRMERMEKMLEQILDKR